MTLFMDVSLSRRIERAEAAINASFIDARARLYPGVDVMWTSVGGTFLLFDGKGSQMTQTFGLGLWGPADSEHLSTVEAFFTERGADVVHEVSPLAGVELSARLAERGYRPVEMATLLVRPLDEEAESHEEPSALRARVARPEEAATWIETSVAGWSAHADIAAKIRDVATVAFSNPSLVSYLVERGGEPIATASLGIHEDVALLAGASTVAAERGRGAQRALLDARLAEAKRRGCKMAVMGAEPGSGSQRNAERNGFRVAYTRTKWRLPSPAEHT